jgi:outer membrane protein OmpA-like peptidoglycan-associated protein
MRKINQIILLCAAVVLAAACSKSRAEQMKLAENVQIQCNPEVLALVGDQIPVDLTVTYPDGYFHPKAILEVTPVLVYGGGEEQKGPTFVYQGEKVLDNFKVVYKAGGTVTEHFSFNYEEGVEQAYLELRGLARYKDKEIAIPAVKVADGTIVTQLLAETEGYYSYKKDNYQAVLHEQTEGQVMYDYNSSTIKNSELRSQSIKELQAALAQIEADPRYTVKGTSVVAYASPEGGQAYNAKLSDQRAASAEKAWSKVTGEKNAPDNLEVRSIGQDWEGFREAVAKSDIEDKELILRVLSMYSDPAVRESEIKNMSKVYTEINKNVFPELRRARFITEMDYQNFSDEELVEMSRQAVDVLDEEGLLRVASITSDAARKAELYNKAVEKFGSDRARFNLAAMALDDERPDAAARQLDGIKEQDADVLNARGVVELQRGDRKAAADWFRKAGTAEAKANLGLIELMDGHYDAAAKQLAGTKGGVNSAIASLLAGRLDEAEARVTCKCAHAEYVRAVIAARKGDAEGVKTHLANVEAKDKSLFEKSRKDIEFAKFR